MKNIHTFENFINEGYGNISMYKNAVQTALKQLGYDVKQSDLKVGSKRESNYDLITLNGELLCSSSDYAQMNTWIQNAIKEDPKKYGLDPKVLESVNENYKENYKRFSPEEQKLSLAISDIMWMKFRRMDAKDKINVLDTLSAHIKATGSLQEAIDTKYWMDYNVDTSGKSPKDFADKNKNFEDCFSHGVSEWNSEADSENRIKGAQIDKVKKLAKEFFSKEGWISVNIVLAMIMQES